MRIRSREKSNRIWECSAVGSAFALHARGHEFESRHFQMERKKEDAKAIAKDQRRSKEKREEAVNGLRLEGASRNRSRTRVRNRCVDTGNPRFVIRWFRRSGLKVRERALAGNLPGVYKVSW